MSIPNLITLARILLVPVVVWAITSGEMRIAFLLFLAAGVSDAVDGFLAKRFGMATELGAYLDPLADKAMIVSIYVALGIAEAIPRWLVILVVSRDIMIVGAVMLSWLVDKPVALKPLLVSKLNTVAQIVLALTVLGALAFKFDAEVAIVTADGAGGGLDLAFDRLLCRGMGAAHERGGFRTLSRRSAADWPAHRPATERDRAMIHRRHLAFWIVTLVVFVFLLWLLSDILLPFVAGLALAYLQTPLADRLERRGREPHIGGAPDRRLRGAGLHPAGAAAGADPGAAGGGADRRHPGLCGARCRR